MTTARPRKNGSDPSTSSTATINPPGAGVTVEHQRERNHADAQRHHGEQETDAATGDDQPPSLWRRQYASCEIGNSGRGFIAECRNIDRLRGGDPGHEQRQQQRAQPKHGASHADAC
jgi:hypothetical protein